MPGEKGSKSAKSAKSSKKEDSKKDKSKSKSAEKDKGKGDKEKSEKDKKSKSGKSEKTNKKSSKGGASSRGATPTREGSKSKTRDELSPSNMDAASAMKSQLGDGDLGGAGAASLPLFPSGGYDAGHTMMGMPSESPFRTQPMLNHHVTQSKTCMLHGKPLRYFCDSCEELLCYDCTVMGPHNTQLHRICNMEEAFRYRFETINRSIH